MRLIDADKLRFRHTVKCNSNTTRPYTLNYISFDEVQNAPTIKAVPMDVLEKQMQEPKTGHWKIANSFCACDQCGYETRPWNNTPFCPNCGADMRGDTE